MGSNFGEAADTLPHCYSFKVHHSIRTELRKMIVRIEKIFPEIEAARPRCKAGIQVLCSITNAIDRAKQVLQYCSEASKLYLVRVLSCFQGEKMVATRNLTITDLEAPLHLLALKGDGIVYRCQKSRNLLEKGLGEIQTMVPVLLSNEISQVIDDLREAKFVLDHSDKEVGKAVRELLRKDTSTSDAVGYKIKILRLAASRLHITTTKALEIEQRSIKKLANKVGEHDPTNKENLNCLLYLLKEYGNSILEEQEENPNSQHEESFAENSSVYSQAEVGPYTGCQPNVAQVEMSSTLPAPPEEYKCPISMRIMYDPVDIASGQTFERIWIQKWFDEGNDRCPKTQVKLDHLSLTPNTAMKDLISNWCERFGVTILNPHAQEFHSLDTSSSSVASLGISMNDLHLPQDISNVSHGSCDAT